MAKLRQKWEKTDIPLPTRIKLWRIMTVYLTYDSWVKGVANISTKFEKSEDKYIRLNRPTYKLLQQELQEMPFSVVVNLPEDLREWLINVRPDLKIQSKNPIESQPKNIEKDPRLLGHFFEMARIARTLAFRQQFLLDNYDWLWYNGFPCYSGTIDQGIKMTGASAAVFKNKLLPPTDHNVSKQLLLHFNWQFPKLAFKTWYKISDGLEQEVADKLKVLGSGKDFTVCPNCPICQAKNNS